MGRETNVHGESNFKKVHMEHTLVLVLVQHAWRERKPLYGWMDMRHGQSYVVQATEPSFIHIFKKIHFF